MNMQYSKENLIKHILVILSVILMIILSNIVLLANVNAQASRGNGSGSTNLNVDESIDIKPITISVFRGINVIPGKYATVLSWLSFIGTVFSVGLIAFWVFLVIKAAFIAAKSEGDEAGLGESKKRVQSTFIGAAVSMIIPAIISVLGVVLGLGPLWTWPVAFRDCPGGTSEYYFQEVLKQTNSTDPKADAEANCFG